MRKIPIAVLIIALIVFVEENYFLRIDYHQLVKKNNTLQSQMAQIAQDKLVALDNAKRDHDYQRAIIANLDAQLYSKAATCAGFGDFILLGSGRDVK